MGHIVNWDDEEDQPEQVDADDECVLCGDPTTGATCMDCDEPLCDRHHELQKGRCGCRLGGRD